MAAGAGGRSASLAVRLGVVAVSLTVSCLVAELLLRRALDPADFLRPVLVADEVLGFRIQPGSNGHDAWGCRNPAVPRAADVVAIGDSLTYGSTARRDESWPAVLAEILDVSVYNLATPGYGPAQYAYQLETKALELKPRIVVVGFYYGNDLEGASGVVYERSHWQSLRDPAVDPASIVQRSIVETEENLAPWARWKLRLQQRSVLYRLVDAELKDWNRYVTARVFPMMDEEFVRVDDDAHGLHTTLTPGKRIRSLDLSKPRIAEGLRLSLVLIERMRDLCRAHAVELRVLILPTKEGVLRGYLEANGIPGKADTVRRALAAEADVDERVKRFLDEHGIAYVDPRAALAVAIDRGEVVYSTDLDGHPNRAGYAVIARSVAEEIRRGGLP
jgi:lysophospholipase L1-like esterase